MRPLVNTPVRPNHLTTVRLAAGLAAAGAFAAGDDAWRDIGAGIFVASMVLDRADGELARLGGKTSPGGHIYDLVADSLCNALAFVGLGVGLTAGAYGSGAVLMGVAAGLAIATVLWFVIRLEAEQGSRAGELGGVAGFDPDDAMLAVPVAIWLGWPEELLLAATIGAPAFALLFAGIYLRRRRKPGSAASG